MRGKWWATDVSNLFMFIIAHLDIVFMALLVASPFYFFNRFLLQKIRPAENGKRLALYFFSVLISASVYSIISVFIMVWIKNKR
jgi:hypothetical protein